MAHESQADSRRIEYCGVRCEPEYFCTMDGRMRKNVVARSRVSRVVLDRGLQAARPMVQMLIGIALIGFLAWPLYRLWFLFRYGGIAFGREGALGALSILGGWLVYDAFRKGWFLKLETRFGAHKLPFAKGALPDGLEDFVQRVHSELGIAIETAPGALKAFGEQRRMEGTAPEGTRG
jgi:hypothetical protein